MKKLTRDQIAQRHLSIEQLAGVGRFPIFGMLDNIRSLYNVGSMFRSADGARMGKLYLTGYTPRPPRKEIEKTALGATQSVPWEYHKHPLEIMEKLKSEGVHICVLEQTDESIPYFDLKKSSFPLCLVVGNEITGVSSAIIEKADLAVEIPMYGMKQSLNAAVAFGIAAFEMIRLYRNS